MLLAGLAGFRCERARRTQRGSSSACGPRSSRAAIAWRATSAGNAACSRRWKPSTAPPPRSPARSGSARGRVRRGPRRAPAGRGGGGGQSSGSCWTTERAMSLRAVALYKAGDLAALRMLFAADGIREFLSRTSALRLLLMRDGELLANATALSRRRSPPRERAPSRRPRCAKRRLKALTRTRA